MSRVAHLIRPSDFKVFKILFKRHFVLSIKNINDLIYPLFYFLTAAAVFKIAIGAAKAPPEVSIGIILVINIFVLILTCETLILRDYKLGFLEQFYLIGCEFSLVILAKYLAHLIIYAFLSICLIPVILFLNEVAIEHWLIVLVSQLLLSGIVLLFLLLSSSMLLGSKAKTLLSVIVLIFAFPALIFATLSVSNIGYLGLLLALLLFLGPIIIFASKYLIIAALEDQS